MNNTYSIVMCMAMLANGYIYSTYTIANPLLYTHLEPQYPSYVSTNHIGLCLRARTFLTPHTVVGTARMIPTVHQYIHDSMVHKHIGIMGFKNKRPIYGRVVGKYAFCNHSCEPNCVITKKFLIKTSRAIMPHEELTVSYNAYLNHIPWNTAWNFTCDCRAASCKKIINKYRRDITHPANYYKSP